MNKSISLRETILVAILFILVAYYFIVHAPIEKETKQLNEGITQMQNEIDVIDPYIYEMRTWQRELDALEAEQGELEPIPDYDNFDNINAELHTIFDFDTESYSITYSDPSLKDNIVSRNIKISYVAKDYKTALSRLDLIHDSKNKYVIGDLSLTDSARGITVSLTVVSYEYMSEN